MKNVKHKDDDELRDDADDDPQIPQMLSDAPGITQILIRVVGAGGGKRRLR
jgi:hypothetical protein